MPTNWFNLDGLMVKMGSNEATVVNAGEFKFDGPERLIEVEIPMISLSTSVIYFPSDTVVLGKNYIPSRVEVYVETACTSGGSPTFNLGMTRLDRTTAVSNTGFINAAALTALDTVGSNILYTPASDSVPAGGATAGSLLGTVLANPGYITASAGTTTYTAGRLICRVYYYKP